MIGSRPTLAITHGGGGKKPKFPIATSSSSTATKTVLGTDVAFMYAMTGPGVTSKSNLAAHRTSEYSSQICCKFNDSYQNLYLQVNQFIFYASFLRQNPPRLDLSIAKNPMREQNFRQMILLGALHSQPPAPQWLRPWIGYAVEFVGAAKRYSYFFQIIVNL